MSKLSEWKDKLLAVQVKKNWITLSYLYLTLPMILFVLANLAKGQSMGPVFASLFHNYGIFCISVIPNPAALTGIVGLGLAVWFLVAAARKKDWLDFGICVGLVALNAAYFLLGWNYLLLNLLGGL